MLTNLHHPDGPSQWPMWEECACYDGEHADADDADVEALTQADEKTEDAKTRGTAQHSALAKALTGQPDAFAGLSETEEKQVRYVAETVVEFAASNGYGSDEIQVEQRVTMARGDSFEDLYFGTCDIRFGCFILDAKFGDERNYLPQLAGYALPIMEREGYSRMYVGCVYGRWRRMKTFVLDRTTAETIAYRLLSKRHSPDRRPRACSFCGWCRHRLTCSALTANVNAVLDKRDDWAMRLPTMSATAAGADPVLLGAMRYLWKAYIEPWGSAVEHASSSIAANGNIPLAFKKQDEKGRLKIMGSGDAAGSRIIEAMGAAGVPAHVIINNLDFTQGMLARAYQAQFGGSEDTAKEKVEAVLTSAGLAARGKASFKLIKLPTAEDDVRAALARPVKQLS